MFKPTVSDPRPTLPKVGSMPTDYFISQDIDIEKYKKQFSHDVVLVENSFDSMLNNNQRTNGPVNAHLISWPSKAQIIQNLENIW